MDPHALRNFKDFLLQYNKISEDCFKHCVNDLNTRDLTADETLCVEKCAYKHVKLNNRAMQVYVEVQPAITKKRIEEMEQKAKVEQQQAAAVVGNVLPEVDAGTAVSADTTVEVNTSTASIENPSDT